MPRRKNTYSGPIYYTTFQVAKHLGVSLPTVVNWVNSDRMRAHRTPGGHRRISRSDVLAFARAHDYPLSREFLLEGNEVNRILIVDDEREFAEMVRDYLAMKGGFEVAMASSGFNAGFTVARFRPGLILMDIAMPDVDGFGALRMLRSDPETRHIPIIACTGFRDGMTEARIEEEGFDGLVIKPLKLDDLLRLVREKLGLPVEV